MTEQLLGRIASIDFGLGGYNDGEIGLTVNLSGPGWGTLATKMAWDANRVKHSEFCRWTEADRDAQYAEIVRYVSSLLKDAKVDKVSELEGKPIEATFNEMSLVSWRILTEVL